MADTLIDNTTMMEETVTSNWTNATNAPVSITFLATQLLSYKAAYVTMAYWMPVIVFVGLAGNIISFLIMLKPHNRRISCCNYMAALAGTDSLILLIGLVYWTALFLATRPEIVCKTLAWLLQANSFASMLLIFSMTVDRFIAIRWPLRARTICTTRRTRITIGCILLTTYVYTLPYFFTAGHLPGYAGCAAVLTTATLPVVYNWVNIFLASIVPFVGLLTMNTFIIVTIRSRGKYFEETDAATASTTRGTANEGFETEPSTSTTNFTNIDPSQDANDAKPSSSTNSARAASNAQATKQSKKIPAAKTDSSSRDNQLTVMLLLVTFTFLLLTLPQYARHVASVLWNYMSSPQSYADYVLTAHVTNRLFNTNSACNFFLYCLSGTRFRQDLISLFRRNK
jgi:hypothetical protein